MFLGVSVVSAKVVAAMLTSDSFPPLLEHGLEMSIKGLLGHTHVLILDDVVDLDRVGDGLRFPAEDLLREVGLDVEELSCQHPGSGLVDVDVVLEELWSVVS